jgi:AmpD protein
MAAAPTADLWDGGWHRDAMRLPSPNYGPRPVEARQSVDLAVVHSISLPPGQYGTGAVQQLFTNTLDWEAHPYFQQIRGLQVSAHFFIERGGRLWQFVDCDQRAWHAGQSAYRGRANCNDDSIGIELEGLEGHLFEPAQYHALAALCHALAERYPLRYLAGHEHVAPGRKQDPGPGFDWHKLATLLTKNNLEFPSQVTPL